jgi:hypothetical protein
MKRTEGYSNLTLEGTFGEFPSSEEDVLFKTCDFIPVKKRKIKLPISVIFFMLFSYPFFPIFKLKLTI